MATPKEPFDLPAPGRVLVVGDIMLDRYTWGHADRVSPEAPVLVMRAESCDVRLGGAGAVAALLRGLDADVLLAGVIGEDHEGETVRRLLDEAGIDGRMLLTDPARPTTLKERFLAHVEQRQPHQILRVDHEQTQALTPDLADQLATAVERELKRKRGRVSFVRSTLRAVPANETRPLFRALFTRGGSAGCRCWSIRRGSATTRVTRARHWSSRTAGK